MNTIEIQNKVPTYDVLDLCVDRMRSILGDDLPVIVQSMDEEANGSVGGHLLIGAQAARYLALPPHVTLREVINRHKTHPPEPNGPVFLLRHLDTAARLRLKAEGVNYVDVAGNCFLSLYGIRAVINIRDVDPVKPPYTGKAFQKKGLVLLFHFLAFPKLTEANYRELQEQTGVSIAATSGIIHDLKAQGFIMDRDGKQVLHNVRELIRRWAYAYLEVLRPSLHRGFMRSRNGDLIAQAQLMGVNDRLFLGGQYAAMMLGDYLSSQNTVVYTSLRLSELSQRYNFRPVGKDREENDVELLLPFWNTEIDPINSFNKLFTADVLTYADLLLNDADSRVLEAAEKFLNDEIRNRFQNAGLQW